MTMLLPACRVAGLTVFLVPGAKVGVAAGAGVPVGAGVEVGIGDAVGCGEVVWYGPGRWLAAAGALGAGDAAGLGVAVGAGVGGPLAAVTVTWLNRRQTEVRTIVRRIRARCMEVPSPIPPTRRVPP
jgi:hypothetical protein